MPSRKIGSGVREAADSMLKRQEIFSGSIQTPRKKICTWDWTLFMVEVLLGVFCDD